MRLNIAGGHTPRMHRQHNGIDVIKLAALFRHDRRVRTSHCGARRGDIDRAVDRRHRFGRQRPIVRITRPAPGRVAGL